jgi:tRNA 2-thiouridine synthesizing protein A
MRAPSLSFLLGHEEGRVVDEPADNWDAGEMGCGELLLALKLRMRGLGPGNIIRVVARDPAAPEEMPAWCRLTGHTLVHAAHPVYDIRCRAP